MVNNVGLLLGLLVHIFWLIFFWIYGPDQLVITNAIGLFIFSVSFYLHRKGLVQTMLALTLLDVPVMSVVASAALGPGTGFEYYCFIMFFYPFTFEKGSLAYRGFFALVSFCCLSLSIFYIDQPLFEYSWGEKMTRNVLLINATSSAIFISLFSALFYRAFKNTEKSLKKKGYELSLAKEKAESSEKTKEVFLANMSHEMRTPLNAIMGYTEMLKFDGLNESQQEHVDTITTASHNLLHVINDLLDLSNIENERFSFKPKNFNLTEVIDEILSLHKKTASDKGLEIHLDTSHLSLGQVNGDPDRLSQILSNIVGNAIKFTEEGHVLIECWNIETDPATIHFAVEDTGIGIAETHLEKIFQRFTQVSDGLKRAQGTGLGLHITKMLVELQNGELHVRSKPSSGSRFEFYLQYKVVEPVEEKQKEENNTPTLSGTILVAEDNEQNQVLASHFLTRMGLEVIVANDGKEALEFCKQVAFDAILMDLEMPHLNGYETTLTLKESGNKTPIIACTAHSLESERMRCLEAGMDDYISKPYSYKELWTVLAGQLIN